MFSSACLWGRTCLGLVPVCVVDSSRMPTPVPPPIERFCLRGPSRPQGPLLL